MFFISIPGFLKSLYCGKYLPRFDERVLVKEELSPASDDYKDPDQGDHQGAAENRLFMDFFLLFTVFNSALSAAPQRMLGLLRLRHWQSDALTTRLDLIQLFISTKIIQHLITLKIKIGTRKEEDGELKKTVYPKEEWC